GIALDDARHVFERLYRADPSRARRHGGAGLGLAIVAAIVQAHRGRVELYTAAGAGARFRVLLPGTAEARCHGAGRPQLPRDETDLLPASYEENSIPL
ncbi:MAG: histidine kinase, partial [Dactylosporangium sp.]|nr:histidine kinase [Dactylosporangium sp.]